MLALGGVAQAREDVIVSEIREVTKNLIFGHSCRKIGEHVVHGNSHATHAWLPASLAGLNRNDSPSKVGHY